MGLSDLPRRGGFPGLDRRVHTGSWSLEVYPMLLIVGETIAAFMRQLTADDDAEELMPFSGPWASGAPAIAAYTAGMLGAPTHLVAGIGQDESGGSSAAGSAPPE